MTTEYGAHTGYCDTAPSEILPTSEWSPTIVQTTAANSNFVEEALRDGDIVAATFGKPRAVRECDVLAAQGGYDLDIIWTADKDGWMTTGQPKAANSDEVADGELLGYPSVRGATSPANPNYTTLQDILTLAYNHAANGKGRERHARDLPFDEQPMMQNARLFGSGFPLGQASKKTGEAQGMVDRGELGRAELECLGAINYLAGAVLWMREQAAEGKVAA